MTRFQAMTAAHVDQLSNKNVYVCSQDADASYDVNGRDTDPQPRYDASNENRSTLSVTGLDI